VPLTNSFYVPGKLSDPDHVIVEVGTGYFVQQLRAFCWSQPSLISFDAFRRAQAVKHYTPKVEYVRTNLETGHDK
jgi:prefoldin alpha subunit